MICAVHALVGAAVGKAVGQTGKAFAAGVATHLIGDLLPHRDLNPKTEAALLALTLTAIATRTGITSSEMAGAVGGFSPDFENAAQIVGLIPKGAMRFPSHAPQDRLHAPKVSVVWPQALIALACFWYVFKPESKRED